MNYLVGKSIEFFRKTFENFEASYIIVAVVGFSQGIQHLADLSIQYMMKDDFNLSPARMGLYMSYVSFPWVIKPLWGIFTDSKPLFGYRRKSYLIIFGLVGGIGWIMLAYYGINNLYSALGLLLIIQFSVCFTNVVGEAILVELSGTHHQVQNQEQNQENSDKEFQKGASRNVSLFFGIRAVGVLISAYFSGALLIWITKKEVFLITSIFPFLLAIVAFFFNEQKVNQQEMDNQDRRVNSRQCLVDFWEFFKNPLIFKPVLLIFCFMMAPSSGAIMFFFYTNVLGFSPQFLGQLKFLYAIGTISGVLLYNNLLRDVPFRKIFISTSILYYLCYQSLIILVTRKNVEWGINDKFFCIGDSVMLQLVAELNMMPILVLACRMCPKNIEGTMYAMLMSTINMGSMLGSQWGALFLIIIGVNQNDYSRLWLFILITGIFILLPLPFVGVVRESAILKQRQELVEEQNQHGTDKKIDSQISNHSIRALSADQKTGIPNENEEEQKLLQES